MGNQVHQKTIAEMHKIAIALRGMGAPSIVSLEGGRLFLTVKASRVVTLVFREVGSETRLSDGSPTRVIGTVFVRGADGINLPYAPSSPKYQFRLPARTNAIASSIMKRMDKALLYTDEIDRMLQAAMSKRIRKEQSSSLAHEIAGANGVSSTALKGRNGESVVYTNGVTVKFSDDLVLVEAVITYDQIETVMDMVDVMTKK